MGKTKCGAYGKLHVEGAYLVDEQSEKVQLYGMSTHGMAWYPQYVCKETFQFLKEEWKTNAVRLAMYTDEEQGYCSNGDKAAIKELMINGVKAATELGMYVIIDWHILREQTPMKYKEEAIAFFEEMSGLFADQDNVLYELCNEPNGEEVTWQVVKAYAEELIPVIRKNAPDSVIIVGTPTWSQDIHEAFADPLKYDNIMYTLHFYADTHRDSLRDRMEECITKGLPVFVSEFGMCDASGAGNNNLEQTKAWFDLIDKYHASFFCWAMGNRDECCCIIKPESEKLSGWTKEDLTDSGLLIRERFLSKV